ncbi:hypothetical protein V8D89_002692 [Ganoderma adspersum]
MAGPSLANSHAAGLHLSSASSSQALLPQPPFLQPHPSSSGPPSALPSSTPAQTPPPPHSHSHPSTSSSSARSSLAPTRVPSSSYPSDKPASSHSASTGQANTSSASGSPPAGSGPTNDDIEAVIQMAMASSGSSARSSNPPRDTRTQLFVGNLPYRVRWQDLKDLFRRAGTVLRADVSLGPDNRSRGYGTVLLATAEDAGRAIDMFNGYTWQTRTLEVRPDRMGEDVALAGAGYGLVGMGGVPLAAAAAAAAGALGGVGVFATPLAGSISPVPVHASAALSANGAGTPAGGAKLAAPAPSLGGANGRFAGLTPFGMVEEDGSRPGTGCAQPTRNLFVGNLPFHIQWQDLKDLFRQAGAVQRADVALGADGRSRGFGTVSFSNEADAERAVRMFNGYEYNGRPLKVHFDKFAPPASSSAPLVGPTAGSAFSNGPTHSLASPFAYNYAQQVSQSRATSLARELLHSSAEHPRVVAGSLLSSWRPSEQGAGYTPYGAESSTSTSTSSAEHEAALAAQLAQKLSVSSPPHRHAQTQSPTQSQFARHPSHPGQIPIPPVIQSPYTFDFLHSGPPTPYDVYDLSTYQRMNAGMGLGVGMGGGMVDMYSMPQEQVYAQPQVYSQQMPHAELNGARNGVETSDSRQQSRPAAQPAQEGAVGPSKAASGSISQPVLPTQSQVTPPARSSAQSAPQTTSPASSSSRSHPTPQQQHHHPAHPGPIALPPPPPVTAFPGPPPHTLSPPYPSPHLHGHPMSPLHHPFLMGMPMMTPHGLPPITPSMPSFTFLPQPSPGLPSPVAPAPEPQPGMGMYEHMRHVMASYTPFSPGVTMSPGVMWGGSSANPFINAAVGAPVHPGQYYAYAQQQQQQQQQQPRPQSHAEQDGGYFPPMAREEPGGYFPWVPSPPPQGDGQTQSQRSSGLANEILRERDDGARLTNGVGHHQNEDSPGDVQDAVASPKAQVRAQACARGSLDVETFEDDSAVGVAGTLGVNGHSSAKPRSYSAQSNGTQGAGSARGSISRADSDPGKKAAVVGST